jgi:hypothetical protein
MRPVIAAFAGGGAAIGVSLACSPVVLAVRNLEVVRGLGIGGVTAELAWALPIGVVAGIVGPTATRPTATRAWPITAFGAWLVWASVFVALLALRAVPALFAAFAMSIAFVIALAIAARWHRPAAGDSVSGVLAACCGFGAFVVAYCVVVLSAFQVRPAGVTFEEFRRYKGTIDVWAGAALALGVLATVAIAIAFSPRRRDRTLALLVFGILLIAAMPMLAFLSSCYVGEVLTIFRWLVSPSC